MTALIVSNPKLPAAVARLVAVANANNALQEMTGGITSGFPILSIKGKVWRGRVGGEEQMYLDAAGNAMPSLDMVLVRGNPLPSKIYYDKAFVEGSTEPPRCFSNDGLKPDISVQEPINAVCASCPKNAWGSKTTEQGKKARACADARRVAVVMSHDLLELGDKAPLYLLRIPAASLNPLKDYAEKMLAPKGIPQFAVVTTLGFDPQVAHPQLTFKAARFLNDDEAEAIIKLRDSEDAKRILAEANEFATGGATSEEGAQGEATGTAVASAAPPAQVTTPPVASKPVAAKPARTRPATEEEAGLGIAPAPPTAAAVAAPAAAKPKAAAKPAAAPKPAPVVAAPVVEEVLDDTPEAAAAAGGDDLQGMLDSILNG